MNEIDKLIHQLNNVASWLRAGKDNEAIRKAMYESAVTVCRQVCTQIDQLAYPIPSSTIDQE